MNRAILAAKKIYLDTNILIYFVESHQDYQDMAAEILEYADANGVPLIMSEIAVAECLLGAYKIHDDRVVQAYQTLFHDTGLFHLVPLELALYECAARVGAEQQLKLIDAIHVASATVVGCDLFITNDRRIRTSPSLAVVQIGVQT